MDFSNLTEDQKARARACSSPEELLALAREEGVELSDAELEQVAGGARWGLKTCETYINCPSV